MLQKHPTSYTDSLASVLHQEVFAYNKLVNRIKESVSLLQQALRGLTPMNKELDELVSSVYFGTLPSQWKECSYPRYPSAHSHSTDSL